MSFAKNKRKYIGKNASKNVSGTIKTASKREIQKAAEATDDLIANKIAYKIGNVSGTSSRNSLDTNTSMYIHIYLYLFLSLSLYIYIYIYTYIYKYIYIYIYILLIEYEYRISFNQCFGRLIDFEVSSCSA